MEVAPILSWSEPLPITTMFRARSRTPIKGWAVKSCNGCEKAGYPIESANWRRMKGGTAPVCTVVNVDAAPSPPMETHLLVAGDVLIYSLGISEGIRKPKVFPPGSLCSVPFCVCAAFKTSNKIIDIRITDFLQGCGCINTA